MKQNKVQKRNGKLVNVNLNKIQTRLNQAGKGLNVDTLDIASRVVQGLYDGITTSELDRLAADTAASFNLDHPDYLKLAGNIAVSSMHKDVPLDFEQITQTFKLDGVLNDIYLGTIESYGLKKIAKAIDYNRDFNLDYFGYKTLEKSYLLRTEVKVQGKNSIMVLQESPQDMYMRVALTVTKNWDDALDTYNELSNWAYSHATPTLFNSGLKNPQLASCFLINNKGDDKHAMLDTLKDTSVISSGAGGIGLSFSNVRAKGSKIHSSGGVSNGLMPLLRTYNEAARWWDQSFSGNTPVLTKEGYINIEDIKVGDTIINSKGEDEVIDIKGDDYEGEIYLINGVKVTPEHPIYVIKNSDGRSVDTIKEALKHKTLFPEWVKAKDLTLNDYIVKQ